MKKIILITLIAIATLESSWIKEKNNENKYDKYIKKWEKSDQEKANEYNEKNLKKYQEEIRIQEWNDNVEKNRINNNKSLELESSKIIKGKITSYSNTNDSKSIIKVNNNSILIEQYDMDNILESNINKIELICTEKRRINYTWTFINCDLTLIYE